MVECGVTYLQSYSGCIDVKVIDVYLLGLKSQKHTFFQKLVQWCRGDDLRIETLHLFGHGLLCCGDTTLMFLL